jgi:hypothetical protein
VTQILLFFIISKLNKSRQIDQRKVRTHQMMVKLNDKILKQINGKYQKNLEIKNIEHKKVSKEKATFSVNFNLTNTL